MSKETRSERVNISLKPSTLAKVERLANAAGKPLATVISDFVEEGEMWFPAAAATLERINATRAKATSGVIRSMKLKG